MQANRHQKLMNLVAVLTESAGLDVEVGDSARSLSCRLPTESVPFYCSRTCCTFICGRVAELIPRKGRRTAGDRRTSRPGHGPFRRSRASKPACSKC